MRLEAPHRVGAKKSDAPKDIHKKLWVLVEYPASGRLICSDLSRAYAETDHFQIVTLKSVDPPSEHFEHAAKAGVLKPVFGRYVILPGARVCLLGVGYNRIVDQFCWC